MPRVVVDVMPKPEILDPQGKAVLGALPRLGFAGVTDVRQGKRFELELRGRDHRRAARRGAQMAETLLSNPVIENFEVRVEPSEADAVRVGVVTFPGSLDDVDAQRAVGLGGHEAVALWHGDHDLRGVDAVVLPGGFSYGDYLRCGAISRFSPVMTEVVEAAGRGMPVLGICNGFQILCESHLLPGALIRNDHRKFVCRDQRLRIENTRTAVDVVVRRGRRDHDRAQERRGRLRRRRAPRSTGSRARAGSWPATSTATPTARCATSPGSPTSAATWSA